MAQISLPVHGVGDARPDFATLCAMFDHAAAAAPARVALRQGEETREETLRWGDEARAAAALAVRLAGVAAHGEVVALLLPNAIAFRVAYGAAIRAALAPALLSPAYPAPQLETLLREVAPRAILCAPAAREAALRLAPSLGDPAVICLGQDLTLAALTAAPAAPPPRAARPGDVGALLFSGGTTGLPKAVAHTHERLLTAVRCVEYNWPTRSGAETWLPVAPFTHIYGFLQGLLAPVFARAEVVIPGRFEPAHIVDLLARHRVTVFGGGPPALYAGVLAAPNLAGADLSALRVCPAGGAPFPAALLSRWREATGRDIHEGYGMTEMAPISGASALTGLRPGAVGRPMPCNEVQIVDPETGTRVLPPGTPGEVRVRGPHMMTGYRNRPEETARILRDGFIHTGDIGHLDADGFLFITDRKKDVVLVKGFNVFPREVEEAILTHPDVAACGVVGAPDPRSGERVVAYVVPRAGARLDEAAVAAHVGARLVAYKCPSVIRIVEALPVTAAHKLDRVALRRRAREEAGEPPA